MVKKIAPQIRNLREKRLTLVESFEQHLCGGYKTLCVLLRSGVPWQTARAIGERFFLIRAIHVSGVLKNGHLIDRAKRGDGMSIGNSSISKSRKTRQRSTSSGRRVMLNDGLKPI